MKGRWSLNMDSIKELIANTLSQYVWSDSKKLKSLLSDIIPTEKLLIRLLVLSYEEGIYDELQNVKDERIVTHKAIKKLVNEYGISEENAIRVVGIWRQVLGLSEEFEYRKNEKDVLISSDEIIPRFLSVSNRYYDLIKMQRYINENDDIEKEFELLGLYYGVLVNPTFETASTNVLWLANKCLTMMEDLISKCSINRSISNEYRIIRLKWIRSFIYMINGQYIEAYQNYKNLISIVDRFLMTNAVFYGGCFFMYYLSEVNMHVLAEVFGVNDEDFCIHDRYEIEWFKKKCSIDLSFRKPDGWMLGTMSIIYDEYINPFWSVFKAHGTREANCISYNMRTLKIVKDSDGLYLSVISMGNSQFLGNESPFTWRFNIDNNTITSTREYIRKNKYVKENNYIHNCMENAMR